ncbi:hypothetical protein CAEBREN_12219 [Caenorhabditis brenneri]|uniref:Uncharacterized protein n=1 Tax=Caenorhabditis brenneri TaxID=135651 RepID=G0NNG3_CAEBE|nr:hypothetical protein CAEBREN_12219 [Caenorhabditis brenneri]
MEEPTPSNIEQELLAEIQVYRNKQKRWEDSQTARKYKDRAMDIVFKFFFIYVVYMTISLFFPSILPSIHAELSAIYVSIIFSSIILAWFESRTALSEKKSIDNSNFEDFQSKVENNEKAQGLLDQLKHNHEMYLQKLHKEYIYGLRRLSSLMSTMFPLTNVGFYNYKIMENGYVLALAQFAFVYLIIGLTFSELYGVRGAIYFIFWLSLAWCMVLAFAAFVPSILPSNHPDLSAIYAGFLLAGVNLGLYDIVMLPSEKKSITHYESRAAEDKKALALLDQLKQNQETYQQKVDEEFRKSFLSFSRLLVAICSNMIHANLKYKFVGESYVAGFLFCVFFFSTYAAHVYCDNTAYSYQKPEEKLLVKRETLTDLNIEQKLLAEIQVYRDKQKRWEESKQARLYKNLAMTHVCYSFFVYTTVILISIFFPSILPSNHAELSAFYAAAIFFSVLLAWYESRKVSLEKRSIDNSNFEDYQSKVENGAKAQRLLEQLKQKREMYLQEVNKEYKMCIITLVRLKNTMMGMMTIGFGIYKVLEGTIVPIVCWIFWIFFYIASGHFVMKLDDPNLKFIDWDF